MSTFKRWATRDYRPSGLLIRHYYLYVTSSPLSIDCRRWVGSHPMITDKIMLHLVNFFSIGHYKLRGLTTMTSLKSNLCRWSSLKVTHNLLTYFSAHYYLFNAKATTFLLYGSPYISIKTSDIYYIVGITNIGVQISSETYEEVLAYVKLDEQFLGHSQM
jgi:hypothetical protein